MPSILLLSVILGILAFWLLCGLIFCIKKITNLTQQVKLRDSQFELELKKRQRISAELIEAKQQLTENLMRDPLTDLPSKQVFEDRLSQTVLEGKRYQLVFGVLFLDIDEFKVINTALGHDVGDTLLKEIAKRLQGALRQVDTVARFSGDRFVLLLPQIAKAESCGYVAQRLLDTISQPFHVRNKDLFVTASIGIAIYPVDASDGKTLLTNAENALHQAKLRGCNLYQFYRPEMHQLSQRELVLNSGLHDASVYQEFKLYYQPIVNIQTKKVVSMEALLRWEHPEFGLITPHEFLRLAENNGKISQIGEWVLRTVCYQYNQWKKQGLDLTSVSVNISLRQLENPHFVYKVSQILRETEMGPQSLVLEISEGAFQKIDLLEKSLHMLKRIGVQASIDDFGTGHLSLQQLKRLFVNYLKIDSSFVQDIPENPENETIIKMMIALSQGLNQCIIAEGVETQQQKEMLQQWGCYHMQGHYFSVPRKAEEFTLSMEKTIGEA